MKSKMILACAGLAVCGASQGQLQVNNVKTASVSSIQDLHATGVRRILGRTAEGKLIVGPEIALNGTSTAARGTAIQAVYDSLGLGTDGPDADTEPDPTCGIACGALAGDGFRFLTGDTIQNFTDDFSVPASFAGAEIDESTLLLLFEDCDLAAAPLGLIVEFFDDATPNPAGLATEGFDNDGDGITDAPFDRATSTGAAIFTFGGGAPVGPGFFRLIIDDLIAASGGVPFYSLPSTDRDGDPSTVEGSFEVSVLNQFSDTDGDGTIDLIGFMDTANIGLWGADANDTSGCAAADGIAAPGTSTNGLWAEGNNLCPPGSAGELNTFWSSGAVDPTVNFSYEMDNEVGAFAPPAGGCPDDLHWSIFVQANVDLGGPTRLCADQNVDGAVTPTDFSAFVGNFNTRNILADVNQDGFVTPTDFSAWVGAFNLGAAGPLCP